MTTADTPRPFAAVGIIVLNQSGQVLVGERLSSHGAGTYQIPGGHLEFGLTFEQAARREVAEETGLTDLTFEKIVCLNNERVYGKHFVNIGFLVRCNGGKPGNPEPDKSRNWRWYEANRIPEPMFAPSKAVLDAWRSGTFFNEVVA